VKLFFKECVVEAFLRISILFEDIFREIEVFLINVRVFQRRLFPDIFKYIFREIEALIRNLWLFQRLRGFLKTFSMEY
jgi:hypothetical protein